MQHQLFRQDSKDLYCHRVKDFNANVKNIPVFHDIILPRLLSQFFYFCNHTPVSCQIVFPLFFPLLKMTFKLSLSPLHIENSKGMGLYSLKYQEYYYSRKTRESKTAGILILIYLSCAKHG